MKAKIFVPIAIALFTLLPAQAHAHARFSTYLEGTIIQRTNHQMVVASAQGTYWINLRRPISYTHHISQSQIGFWVGVDQITKFRPAMEQARHVHKKQISSPDYGGPRMVADKDYRKKSNNEG